MASLPSAPNAYGNVTCATSMVGKWQRSAAGMPVSGTVITPATAFVLATLTSSSYLFVKIQNGRGTNLRIRYLYDGTTTAIGTQPKHIVMGRWSGDVDPASVETVGAQQHLEVLPNYNGDTIVAPALSITTDWLVPATAATSGTKFVSNGAWTTYTHDIGGCDELFVFMTQQMAITTGVAANCYIEAKVI